ncbi:MAG: trehalose/maltose transport system substrate-binding protein [Thermoleophilaceae bacterium]|nr:trehalose/maltose transport system substrate-binding protein [Thermoleophilaceae bacterium]
MVLGGRTSAVLATLALAAGVASGCGGSSKSGGPVTLNWYVFNEPSGSFTNAAAKCSKESGGRYKIVTQALPTDADQQRELIVRRLAAKDSSVDIVGMDVIWTAEFAEAGWIKQWSAQDAQKVTQGDLPGPLATAKYKGKLYAAPLTSNTQILFYRKDRVPTPPKTWDELIQDAQKLGPTKGKIQVQGARYEGLTVWFNSLVASAGGSILTNNGTTIALGPPAVKAADVIKRIASSPEADPALENNKEDQARLGFESGSSAFEVNYTFAWASANDAVTKAPDAAAKKKAEAFRSTIGFARWPSVDPNKPSHVTLGGINLGIGSYGQHQALAFQAATCLRQPANQIPISLKGGLLPTTASLYNDPQLKKAFPFTNILKAEIADGVARPVTPFYSDISQAIQRSLHPERDINPQSTINDMKSKLEKAKNGELF